MAEETAAEADPASIMRSRSFLGLLLLASVIGLVVSFMAWCFLELINEIQTGVFDDLPGTLGFDSKPAWWPLPVLLVSGVIVAFAIARLRGNGGHVPVHGLDPTPATPPDLPGIALAALAGIGLGVVLGPEAPLIALGGGLGFLLAKILAADAPEEVATLLATCGIFAAISFLFGSPLIAAVFLVEAAGLDKSRLNTVLIPGLLAAGIGSLVSIGMGSWTGVDTSAFSLAPVQLETLARPDFVDFLWTIPLAAAIAVGAQAIFAIGRLTERFAVPRPFVAVPLVGVVIAGLAIGFHEATDKGVDQVLFSGQESLGPLVANAGAWSLGALALLVLCKGAAYAFALGSFRGGPVFPAMLLGAAAGLMAGQLPGFGITPAVAVGLGAAVVSVLRLPLSAVVLATLISSSAGLGPGPLIIFGVVVAYLVTIVIAGRTAASGQTPQAAPAAHAAPT